MLIMRNSIKTSVESFTNRMDCVKNSTRAGRQSRGIHHPTEVDDKFIKIKTWGVNTLKI